MHSVSGERNAPSHARAAAPAAIAVAVFTIWIGFSIGGATVTTFVDDLATLAAATIAAISCLAASRRAGEAHRRFWLLLAAACAAWAFGEGAWAVYDLVLGTDVPVPSYADLGYLGAVPLAVAALLCHPAHRHTAATRARATLDGSILATALLFLSWTFALGPVWRQNDMATAAGLVSVGYPFGDVVILFLLVRVLLRLDGSQRHAVGLVLVGLFAMTGADSAYTSLTAVRDYATGDVIDAGWLAAYVAIAVGARIAARSGPPPIAVPRSPQYDAPAAAGILVPYVPLFLALGVLTVRAQGGTAIDRASLLLAFALTGLVLVRQGIAAVSPGGRP